MSRNDDSRAKTIHRPTPTQDTGITQNIASLEKMTQKKLRNLLENIVRDNSARQGVKR